MISNNNILNNDLHGLVIEQGIGNTITRNLFYNNKGNGIDIYGDNNKINYNIISSSGFYGIAIDGSKSNQVTYNNISNVYYGINVYSENNHITKNNIKKCHIGVYLHKGKNTVSNNMISSNSKYLGNSYGVYATGNNNKILNNKFSTNTTGIKIKGDKNTLFNNQISSKKKKEFQ